MPVSAAERDYLLAQLDRLAQTDLNNLWRQAESLSNIDFFGYVSAAFPDVVDVYHQTAGQLAATWFEESNPASSYVAQVVEPLARQQLVSSVEWALGADGEQAVSRMSGTMQRAVYGGARDTVVLNAEVTGSRWLRVARPNACEFCRMLATRTGNYAYTSKAAAEGVVGMKARNRRKGARKLGEKYHDHCHCQAVEIRDTQTVDDVLNDEQRKLFRQWNDEYDKARANAGTTETKKLLAAWREQNAPIVQISPVDSLVIQQDQRFVSVLPLKSAPSLKTIESASADARASNPSWTDPRDTLGDLHYRDNCTHCVVAYEMRRQGYDVEATPTPIGTRGSGRATDKEILSQFTREGTAGVRPTMQVLPPSDNDVETLRAILGEQPEGARGFVSIEWETGGGHIFSWEKVEGKVVYLEPQTGDPVVSETVFDRVKTDASGKKIKFLLGSDRLVPDESVFTGENRLVRPRAEGEAERAKVQAKREKKLAKQQEINKRKPKWDLVFQAADDANYERASFAFGVNNAVSKTAKQILANEKKQLTESQRKAYRAGVEWYQQWLAAR